MKLSAKEAKELMPKDYMTMDQLYSKIKSLAESGMSNLFADLTLGQIDELKSLGYNVDYAGDWKRNYKIEWK